MAVEATRVWTAEEFVPAGGRNLCDAGLVAAAAATHRDASRHIQHNVDKGTQFYEQNYREQQIKMLSKKAAGLGWQLIQSA